MFRLLPSISRYQITNKKPTKQLNHFFIVLQNQNPSFKSYSDVAQSPESPSFTVDYLISSCGLSPPTALTVAEKFKSRLVSTEKPDSVISLFESHGLTKTQISDLISKRPSVLLADPDKTLKPKIEFLHDLGVSGPSLAKLISSDPTLLTRSLEKRIIPSMNYLRTYLGTNSEVLIALRRSTWVLQYDVEKVMGPNIETMRDHGVSELNISKLLASQPRTLMHKNVRFKNIVEKVKEIGFDPSSPMFYHAVRTVAGMSQVSWEKKLVVYREFGWSKTDVLRMFKKQPFCMMVSEKKIRKGLNLFMEVFKWKPSEISLRPSLLQLSLEKRTIPRCSVLEILNSKGIRTNKMKLGTILKLSEREFVKKFVAENQHDIPEVIKAHKGEYKCSGFGEVLKAHKGEYSRFGKVQKDSSVKVRRGKVIPLVATSA